LNPEARLAAIISELESVGLSCLIMGGHAVRYYGLVRYTNDFDFAMASEGWEDLATRLGQTHLFAGAELREGNSGRPGAFRRFLLDRSAEGQEAWLEFWRENHLLAPFPELFSRREVGTYGGNELAFLELGDLIRSKETERARDWEDITYLEEVQDARLRDQVNAGAIELVVALSRLRSRRGFDMHHAEGRFNDAAAVRAALELTANPITQAFLLPFAPDAEVAPPVVEIEKLVAQKLRSPTPATPLHHSLVEIVRRRYKLVRQEQDRADKDSIRAKLRESGR